jgi:hypothetical protein
VVGAFEDVHAGRVVGSLAMFDRMIFKGHLTALFKQDGARCFLWTQGVALKDFAPWVKATTGLIAQHVRGLAEAAGRPVITFEHGRVGHHDQRKDDLARSIAARDGITEGIVCLISAMQPCRSFQVSRFADSGKLQIRSRERKCLHHYLYLIDPEFGFMHVYIQGWMPWEIGVYINGREWLARRLDKKGIGYLRHDNALLRIDDIEAAARLCERFVHKDWPRVLGAFARRMNPVLPRVRAAGYGDYYWVLDQAEIATDVMFKTRADLLAVWPDLVRHATLALSSEDVLAFLGRKLHPSLAAEVVTDGKRRQQGWRVKHRMGQNWLKVYDKVSVLRAETVINNPREFRILRLVTNPQGRRERRWCQMRKGVSDMWRYYQVGMAANHRYLDALADAPLQGKGVAALDALCRPRTNHGRTYARFNPLTPADLALFKAVLAGEHAIRGFRNTDIASRLYTRPPTDTAEAHRRCQRVSRLIVKLRGHGLVAKVPRARRYRITHHGHRLMSAALYIHDQQFPAQYLRAS